MLASFDDAHNQADIFNTRFSDKACAIGPCLEVRQVDRDREIKRYLARTAREVKRNYTYLTAFNLDHYFDILKFSPGMEEYALVSAFKDLAARCQSTHDYLLIDMPPTALSLRFFALPSLSLTWIDQLETIRNEINNKKEIISRIRFAGREFEQDKVLKRLEDLKADFLKLRARFEDPDASFFYIVSNTDALSIAETRRIMEQMEQLSIPVKGLIQNERMLSAPGTLDLASFFPRLPVQKIKFSPSPLIGMPALEEHISSSSLTFENIL
jgi:arsenite-transporting ATPase